MDQTNKNVGSEKNARIYKKEMQICIVGALVILVIGVGCTFMIPFSKGLLNTKIWGFPFPYWYQTVINWLGITLAAYIISELIKKNEDARLNAEKEEEI